MAEMLLTLRYALRVLLACIGFISGHITVVSPDPADLDVDGCFAHWLSNLPRWIICI